MNGKSGGLYEEKYVSGDYDVGRRGFFRMRQKSPRRENSRWKKESSESERKSVIRRLNITPMTERRFSDLMRFLERRSRNGLALSRFLSILPGTEFLPVWTPSVTM